MAEYDLVIRAGSVADGDGGPVRTADVAVSGGVIREVGRVAGLGRREIDAGGAVVTPGFVDLHTHYDGQATWDQRLQPSSWNGVTTVVMGNCGVGFAPVQPENRDRLIELMEGVEDIPGAVMREGLSWEWDSFPHYLDLLTAREFDVDVAAQVPHAAIRVQAMGDRAEAYAQATEEEIGEMARLVREAVDAGAVGFSTSRSLNHKSISGDLTPSYEASADELLAIAAALGGTGKGVLQVISDFPDIDAEFGLMRRMAATSGRPLSFTLTYRRSAPERHREILRRVAAANAEGLRIRAQVGSRGIGALLGLQCTLHPFILNPVWCEISHLPFGEQIEKMADPLVRRAILEAQTGTLSRNVIGGRLVQMWDQMYELTDPPQYEPDRSRSVEALAARAGVRPEELAYDIMLRDRGLGMLYVVDGWDDGSLQPQYEMLNDPNSVSGLSDGGAHVATICDGSFPTMLLQHWVRDREGDRLDLPFAVRKQTRDTADAVGLTDRGRLVPGLRADINVIDMDRLCMRRPEMHFDLPAGGRRLLQRVDGYAHTFVAGIETYRYGEPTGALPGRLVRA
jgi:N-acyl-D-aspartate/D-glutamate deacylase